jgi:hypothetical protein
MNPITRSATALSALALWVPFAPEAAADATAGDDACVATGCGSATPAALPCRTRDASDVGEA